MACLWNQGAYSCLTILLNLPVAEEVNNGFEKKHKINREVGCYSEGADWCACCSDSQNSGFKSQLTEASSGISVGFYSE